MAEEYQQVSEHKSADGWVSRDYLKSEDEVIPDEFEEARLFKGIIEYEDETGTKRYLSTNIFRELDEMEDAVTVLASEYGIEVGEVNVIIRAYY